MSINFTWTVCIRLLLSRQAWSCCVSTALSQLPSKAAVFAFPTRKPQLSLSPNHQFTLLVSHCLEQRKGRSLGSLPQRSPYSVLCCGMGSLLPFIVVRNKDTWLWYLFQTYKVGIQTACPISQDILVNHEKRKPITYCSVRWLECPGWCSRRVDKNSVLPSLEMSNIYSGSITDIMGNYFCKWKVVF